MTRRHLNGPALTIVAIALLSIALAPSLESAPVPATGDDAVNSRCPISQEPISAGIVTDWAGQRVGFCCGGCKRQFEGWADSRKNEFVETALAALGERRDAGQEATGEKPAATAPDPGKPLGDPYPLDFCAVSGQKLGSMGDPVLKLYEGREVRFCCQGCVAPFEEDPKTHWKKIDEAIVKQQLPHYPLDMCPVMEELLVEDGEDIGVNLVHHNRLVRLCCKGCVGRFQKDPERYLQLLDKTVIARQGKDYPLDTCIVAGSQLGSMGEPAQIVVANRLVRFCCGGCVPAFKKDPARYLAKLEAAWKARAEK